jgi:hypothetical protein
MLLGVLNPFTPRQPRTEDSLISLPVHTAADQMIEWGAAEWGSPHGKEGQPSTHLSPLTSSNILDF